MANSALSASSLSLPTNFYEPTSPYYNSHYINADDVDAEREYTFENDTDDEYDNLPVEAFNPHVQVIIYLKVD